MNFKIITFLSLTVLNFSASAQIDQVFKAGFEFVPRLNDTGITWAGEHLQMTIL